MSRRDAEDVVLAWLWEVVGVEATEHVDHDDAGKLLDLLGWATQEFKMVESDTAKGLEQGVAMMLDQGWQLHGVTMMATEPRGLGYAGVTCRFVQALVRQVGGGEG